jgi:hypothetical protein
MKKPFFLFFLCPAIQAAAGCGGVCIFASQNQHYYAVNDTVQLSQGSAMLYANYNDCCNALFGGNTSLVWCRNGVPFDTTSGGTLLSPGMYTQQLNVNQPGVYTVFFINFVYPNNPAYVCGTVTVMEHSGPSLTSAPAPLQEQSLTRIAVYPNPASGEATITSESGLMTVKVFTQNGSEIVYAEGNAELKMLNLDVSGFPPGIYIIEAQTAKGTERCKLIRF